MNAEKNKLNKRVGCTFVKLVFYSVYISKSLRCMREDEYESAIANSHNLLQSNQASALTLPA